jgi:hypothetical protein
MKPAMHKMLSINNTEEKKYKLGTQDIEDYDTFNSLEFKQKRRWESRMKMCSRLFLASCWNQKTGDEFGAAGVAAFLNILATIYSLDTKRYLQIGP